MTDAASPLPIDAAETDDALLSREIAGEAGRLLVALREDFGPVEPDDKVRVKALRDAADAASHELLAARLAEARPGDAVLSEEGVDDKSRLGASRVWIVDPLDGTFEYGQGRADFAVHVVLWRTDGAVPRLAAGTVELPAQGITHSVLDPTVLPTTAPADRPVRLVVSRSRPPQALDDIVESLAGRLAADGITDRGVEIVDVGSVGAKVGELLAGRAEAYLHDTGFYEWDLAAPLAIAQAAGCFTALPDGSAFDFNRESPWQPGIVVAVPSIAAAVKDVVLG